MSVTHADTGGRPEGAAGRGGWHNGGVTADLLARARGGDADAFGELVGPHRRELEVHCYRILGSASDAEDVLQEALLAAWQGLGGFEGRASVRTWLYRIATTRSLNALRSARRQRAVLILREVLDFPAREVADMLGTTEESVKSALKRARATLQHQLEPSGRREPPA